MTRMINIQEKQFLELIKKAKKAYREIEAKNTSNIVSIIRPMGTEQKKAA